MDMIQKVVHVPPYHVKNMYCLVIA